MEALLFFNLVFAAPDSCGQLEQVKKHAAAMEFIEALALLRPIRSDTRCGVDQRARAWMVSAQVWFALGEDPSARYSARQAFLLDPLIGPGGDVPVVLADLIEHERAVTVGDKIKPADRTGQVVDLSQRYPIKVSVPSGVEPLIEVRVGGTWQALEVKKLPSGRGRLFGARLPRALRSLSSVSYRFDVDGELMGPFQRKLAQAVSIERRSGDQERGKTLWVVGGVIGVAVVAGAAYVVMNQEPEGCVTNPGTACLELRVRR
ncbi:MAG: hypothetical protein CMH55_03525 [Myxococcales bacterium]|nr:hypothetical protein [Myxococcales bacterium]